MSYNYDHVAHRFNYDWDIFFGWLVAFIAVITMAFLLTSMSVDLEGRKEQNHPEALPSSVTMLNDHSYLIPISSHISPEEICHGGGGSSSGPGSVKSITSINKLDASYVECYRGQTWNDHRHGSPNFAHAMVRVATTPLWWIAFVGAFCVFMIYPAISAMKTKIDNRRIYKAEKEEDKREHEKAIVDAEAKRKELVRAYAVGDLDDVEFEKGLDKIYELVPRPS